MQVLKGYRSGLERDAVQKRRTTQNYTNEHLHCRAYPSRRIALLSVAPVLLLPDIVDAVRNELSLWRQEAGYLSRRAKEAVAPPQSSNAQRSTNEVVPAPPPLNQWLAECLLDIPIEAAQEVADEDYPGPTNYEAEYARLKAQELPYFEAYGACGSCGQQGLQEAAWFNFLSYIQYKVLNAGLQPSQMPRVMGNGYEYLHRNSVPMMLDMDVEEQISYERSEAPVDASLAFFTNKDGRALSRWPGPGSNTGSSSSIDPSSKRVVAFQAAVGRRLLQRLESSDGPLSALERELLALKTAQLDVIRQGIRILLGALQRQGFLQSWGVIFFGASKAEQRNHTVWASGEPAFVKIWQQLPATGRSEAALQAEQGWSQDFVFLLLATYLKRCGVSSRGFRRFPYVTKSDLVAEQFTIRKFVDVSEEPSQVEMALLSQFPEFALDRCPGLGTGNGNGDEAESEEAVGC